MKEEQAKPGSSGGLKDVFSIWILIGSGSAYEVKFLNNSRALCREKTDSFGLNVSSGVFRKQIMKMKS